MSLTLPYSSNARFEVRLSGTTAVPLFFVAFYSACVICIPLFANQSGVPVPVDKITAVLLMPCALLGTVRAFRARPGYLLLVAGYFFMAALSSVSHLLDRTFGCYPITAPAIGLILDAKPFVYILAFYEVLSRRRCRPQQAIRTVIRVILVLALVNGIFAFRDILVGGQSIWGIKLGIGAFGMPLACGLFNHKYSSACLTMLGALSALALTKERLTLIRLLAFASLFTLLIFNGAFKELVGLAIGAVLFLILPSRKTTVATLQTKVLVGSLMVFVGVSSLSYLSQLVSRRYEDYGVEASIRSALHTSAFTLAKEQFPLGTGAGTFGSMPARDIAYSPLYYRFGIFAMYRGGPGDGKYLMDAWWPHILAESGFVGFAFYMALLWYGIIRIRRVQRMNRDPESFFLLCVAIALLINTIGEPTFTVDILQPIVGLVWGAAMSRIHGEDQQAEPALAAALIPNAA